MSKYKNNQEFLDSMKTRKDVLGEDLDNFYINVVETNRLIGLTLDVLPEEDLPALIETYKNLLEDEQEELEEAMEKQNPTEVVKEAIDVLVIGGYLWYLYTGYTYNYTICYETDPKDLRDTGLADLQRILMTTTTLLFEVSATMNVSKALELVVDENLRKFPTTEDMKYRYMIVNEAGRLEYQSNLEEVLAKEILSIESQGRYSGVYYKKVLDRYGHERVVLWCTHEYGKEKKKYLKPTAWKKGDFNSIVL